MGKFAEKAAAVLKKAEPWQDRLQQQEQRLHSVVPSGREEALSRAKVLLDQIRNMSYDMGFGMRSQVQKPVESLLPPDDAAGVPGREKMINLPATMKGAEWFEPKLLSKQALMGFLTEPIGNKLEDMSLDLKSKLDARTARGTRVTGDPSTLPTFYPAAALTAPKGFMDGYRAADKSQSDRLREEMDHRLEKARKEFETALSDEYASSRAKAASAGELIDGLAHWWTKEADGEINQAMGMYLAAAGLLGVGSHAAVKGLWEKRDPRYQKLKAMKDLIKARQRHSPLPVLVTEEHLPAEHMATPQPLQLPDEQAALLSQGENA
jgi:hypothetical protein